MVLAMRLCTGQFAMAAYCTRPAAQPRHQPALYSSRLGYPLFGNCAGAALAKAFEMRLSSADYGLLAECVQQARPVLQRQDPAIDHRRWHPRIGSVYSWARDMLFALTKRGCQGVRLYRGSAGGRRPSSMPATASAVGSAGPDQNMNHARSPILAEHYPRRSHQKGRYRSVAVNNGRAPPSVACYRFSKWRFTTSPSFRKSSRLVGLRK
jgi:hypothetical protein